MSEELPRDSGISQPKFNSPGQPLLLSHLSPAQLPQGAPNSLGGGHDLKAEPPLDVLAGFDRAEPQVLHHHREHVLGGHRGAQRGFEVWGTIGKLLPEPSKFPPAQNLQTSPQILQNSAQTLQIPSCPKPPNSLLNPPNSLLPQTSKLTPKSSKLPPYPKPSKLLSKLSKILPKSPKLLPKPPKLLAKPLLTQTECGESRASPTQVTPGPWEGVLWKFVWDHTHKDQICWGTSPTPCTEQED